MSLQLAPAPSTACAVWLRRDFLIQRGLIPGEQACNCCPSPQVTSAVDSQPMKLTSENTPADVRDHEARLLGEER